MIKLLSYTAKLALPFSGSAEQKYTMDLCLGLDCFPTALAAGLKKA